MSKNTEKSPEYPIVKEYKREKSTGKNVFLSQETSEFLVEAKKEKLGIYELRTIFLMLKRIKSDQIHKDGEQLKLFEQGFVEKAGAIKFTFFRKDFLSEKQSRVKYETLLDALTRLSRYKFGRYTLEDKDGNKTHYIGGLIQQARVIEKSRKVEFSINAYFYSKLITILSYNKAMFEIAFKTESVATLSVYSWLLSLPKEGTIKKLKDFKKQFQVNYEYESQVEQFFLIPIRTELNRIGNVSFNYSFEGDNIRIARYETKKAVGTIYKKEKDYRISKAIMAYKKARKLSDENAAMLLIPYKQYGYDFVYIKTNRKTALKGLEGEEFVNKFWELCRKGSESEK